MYHSSINFNGATQKFVCTCGTEMNFDQGFFAPAFSYKSRFCDALTCPKCGHALDIMLVWDVLEATPFTDAAYTDINAAAWIIWEKYNAIAWYRESRKVWLALEASKSVSGDVILVSL